METRDITGDDPALQANNVVEAKEAWLAYAIQHGYENREKHGEQLIAAVKTGETQVLTREKLLARIAAAKKRPAPVISLRIPEADPALARKQAEQRGLPYQTYIKSLLHQTLTAREKPRVG